MIAGDPDDPVNRSAVSSVPHTTTNETDSWKGKTMRRLAVLAGILAAALWGVAGAMAGTGDTTDVLIADLSGANQPTPVVTDASGFASFTVSSDETSVDYRLYVNDAVAVSQAHIHLGPVGENGPVAAFLFGFVSPGMDSDGLLAEGTLIGTDLIASTGMDSDGLLAEGTLIGTDLIASTGFDGSMGQLLDRLRAGTAYVNVHTDANPPGELRDQIRAAAFNFGAPLSGDALVPPVVTDGAGFAAMAANGSQTELDFVVLTYGLEDVTQAHIHLGAAGENGGVAAFLFGFDAAGVTRDGVLASGTLTEADLIASTEFDGSMGQLLDRLRAGTAYVNVHTDANPPGELRGGPLDRPLAERGRFTDDDDSVHQGNIEAIAAAGITRGCNPPANDNFCPDDLLTRGQGAAFLFRALNLAPGATDLFTDDDGSLFQTEINAIGAVGITLGCNPPANDNFCPDGSMTRAQWASLMVRALGLTAGGGDDLFTDDDGSVHEADIDRLRTAGITLGCNPPANDNFCPDGTLTRAEAASFLARAMGWSGISP